jgi:hypothetical protein
MAIVYEIEAKKRISQLGAKDIVSFLETIPQKFRNLAFQALRPIPGFRKNEPTELKKRIDKLANDLAMSHDSVHRATELDWSVLGHVWVAWGINKFEGGIETAFKSVKEEKCSFKDFIQHIVDDKEVEFSREDFENIFLFSPFGPSQEVDELIKNIPTREEIEKLHKITKMSSEIVDLKKSVSILSADFEEIKKSQEPQKKDDLNKTRNDLKNIGTEIEKLEKRFSLIEELNASQFKTFNQTLDNLHRSNDMLAKRLSSNETRSTNSEKSINEISANSKKLEGIIKSVQKTASESAKEHGHRKISEVEHSSGEANVKLPGVEIFQKLAGETINKLSKPGDLVRALTTNYLSIGIANSAAKKIALSVSVALMTGQLVQFSGSLADTVADASLFVVGGESRLIWNVPAGLCDGDLTAAIIQKALNPKQVIRGLLLRGLNKSAFDIYGYDIRKIVINRLLGIGQKHPELALIATWINSNSTLPDRNSLAELGPIIDTDSLDWSSPKGSVAHYSMPHDGFPIEEEEPNACDLRELRDQFSQMPMLKSELWRRTVRHAIKSMSSISGLEVADATESLLLHWALPWVIVQSSQKLDPSIFFKEYFPEIQDNPQLMAALEKHSELANEY